MIERIISGGQTGADRAALDVAIHLGVDWGGWIPKGRRDEVGLIPKQYSKLVEAPDDRPDTRTAMNVRDSDATLVFSHGPLSGGSFYSLIKAREFYRPHLHVDLDEVSIQDAVAKIRTWLTACNPTVLNVAGPRASHDARIYDAVRNALEAALRGLE